VKRLRKLAAGEHPFLKSSGTHVKKLRFLYGFLIVSAGNLS
jgi:hypothetical protein